MIKPKNQIVRTLKNRVLTIHRDGNWIQKIDLPSGRIELSIDEERVYTE